MDVEYLKCIPSFESQALDTISLLDSSILEDREESIYYAIYEAFLLKAGILDKKKFYYHSTPYAGFSSSRELDEVDGVYSIDFVSSNPDFEALLKTDAFVWDITNIVYAVMFLTSIHWQYETLFSLSEKDRQKYVQDFGGYLISKCGVDVSCEGYGEEFLFDIVLHAEVLAYACANRYCDEECLSVMKTLDERCYATNILSSKEYFDTIFGKMKEYTPIKQDEVFFRLLSGLLSTMFTCSEDEYYSYFILTFSDSVVDFLKRKEDGEFDGREDELYKAVSFCVDELLDFFYDYDDFVVKPGEYCISTLFCDEQDVYSISLLAPICGQIFKELYPLL